MLRPDSLLFFMFYRDSFHSGKHGSHTACPSGRSFNLSTDFFQVHFYITNTPQETSWHLWLNSLAKRSALWKEAFWPSRWNKSMPLRAAPGFPRVEKGYRNKTERGGTVLNSGIQGEGMEWPMTERERIPSAGCSLRYSWGEAKPLRKFSACCGLSTK